MGTFYPFNVLSLRHLRNDVFGGVTTAIVSLPLALAFGVASGVPGGPVAGLYGAICIGFFAALLGGTPTLISEPTGPMTVVFTAIVASLTAIDPENGLAMAFTTVMLAGLVQVLCGVFKLGKYITLMPYSVVSGFMSGIGVILILLQIAPLFGQASPKGGVLGTLGSLPNLLQNLDFIELGLGGLAIALIFAVPSSLKRLVPPQLLALVVVTLISVLMVPDADIRRIGEIPMGLPTLRFPVFTPQQLTTILVDGLVLGMLGCIDTLLTAVIADSLTRTEHDSDKELIGQGIANMVSGVCGGLPGAGATMGTVVNIQTGAKTAVSGLVRALVLLTVVLFAAPLAKDIPMAVLAGIALKVGIDILDWSFLKRAHVVSRKGALIMYGVMLLTVFLDLIVAVGVGVFVANILTIESLSQWQSQNVRAIGDTDDSIPATATEQALLDRANGRVLLFYLSGPMIFGVAKAIAREHAAIVNRDRLAEVVIFDLHDVPKLGVTASLAIENAICDTQDRGLTVLIAGANGAVRQRLEKLGLSRVVSPESWIDSRQQALEAALERIFAAENPVTVA
ncbi:MAG: SulP family inorganic anion transporter [Oscillatoriales cyanobacterium SM2_2_1]|nr:SulP family inorganic anion transporter [Oscillatoriales cyanobacterium SM2_2_1]